MKKIMKIFKKLIELKKKGYQILTHPKTAMVSVLASATIFLSAIFIGYLVAQLDPDGYNIIDNYISDMGSLNHTPCTLFLDFGAMITSFTLLPYFFYLDKYLAPFSRNPNEPSSSGLRLRLSSYGLLFSMVSMFGFFGIGYFSEDRSDILRDVGLPGLHGPFSYLVFGGLIVTGIFFGLLILLYHTKIPRLLGLYMIVVPIIPGLNFVNGVDPSRPFWEWMILFSIFIWIIPVGVYLLLDIREKLKSES